MITAGPLRMGTLKLGPVTFGPGPGNVGAIIRWGRSLDKGIWKTNPALRNRPKWRPDVRFFRGWGFDIRW